jgi:hypothetical protein
MVCVCAVAPCAIAATNKQLSSDPFFMISSDVHLRDQQPVWCVLIIGGGLRPRRRHDADVITRERFPPNKTLFARVWPRGAATRLPPAGGLRVVAPGLRAYVWGDANPVGIISLTPDKARPAGVWSVYGARWVVPTVRCCVIASSCGPHIRCNANMIV